MDTVVRCHNGNETKPKIKQGKHPMIQNYAIDRIIIDWDYFLNF
jgi:hypothetical protein